MKKILLIILISLLSLSGLFAFVAITPTVYAGSFWDEIDGHGTAASPFIVRTVYDLRRIEWFSKGMEGHTATNFAGIHFRLANSLDISNHTHKPGITSGFAGIGNAANPFQGTFDGSGHTIRVEMHYEQATAVTVGGLFNVIQAATIRNLTIAGFVFVDTNGNSVVGGLFGRMQGNVGSTIENVTINADVREGNFSASAVGTPLVGGLGGEVAHTFNTTIGVNAIYSRFEHIRINGSVSSAKTTARIGGVIGQTSMARSGNEVFQRVPIRIYNVSLGNSVVITGAGTASRAGGLIGQINQHVYTVVADVNIPNINITATSQEEGILSGFIQQSAFLAGVNINVHASIQTPLSFAQDSNWLDDKLATFRFRRIDNMRVRNVSEGDRIDARPSIENAITINQEEVTFRLDTYVRHTENKSLKLDFNTKLIVQGAGVTVIEANLIHSGVVLYTRVFEIDVRMSWPTWLNLLLLGIALVLLYVIYQIVVKKKYRNFRRRKNV